MVANKDGAVKDKIINTSENIATVPNIIQKEVINCLPNTAGSSGFITRRIKRILF